MRATGEANLKAPVLTGLLIGLLLGFIDTYGYAVTGYTTAELSPIVSSILALFLLKLMLKRRPTLLEHFVGAIIASGIALSTTITSGMYITYTMLSTVGSPKELGLPSWLYFREGSPLTHYGLSLYLYATAVSAAGIIIAYAFHKHFIEREKLSYPIGIALTMMLQLTRVLRRASVLIPLLAGMSLQLGVMILNAPSIDVTPALQKVLPGSSVALSLDVFVFLLALLIPLNTSIGVGLGNVATFLLVTPVLAAEGLLAVLPTMSSGDLAVAAAPLTASAIVGYLLVVSCHYIASVRSAFKATLRYLIVSKYVARYVLVSLLVMVSVLAPLLLLTGGVPLRFLVAMPAYVVLQLFLTLLTIRVAGETGTTSQATLPLATFTLYMANVRGALPYVLMDPYTGVPMPQFMAGVSMNIIKGGRSSGLNAETAAFLLGLSTLVGAPITLLYGHLLLTAFGLNSPRLNLLRWLPIVTWMKTIYLGEVGSFNLHAIALGLTLALAMLLLTKALRLGGISLYAIMIGMTLTPDVGLLFLIAAVIKYVALRIGIEVYEALLVYTSLTLAGAGVGVGISVAMSLAGVI